MRLHKQYAVTITTGSDNKATVYLGKMIRGCVHAIKYEPGSIEAGADLTITGETTGVPILVKDNAGVANVWYYPRAAANLNTDGSAVADSAEPIYVYDERLKLAVDNGGNTQTGTITVFTLEE